MSRVQRGRVLTLPRVLLYGVEGIGMSTFGAQAPTPIFIQSEDGLDEIDCDMFPLAATYDDVLTALGELRNQQHDYDSVVIESLDGIVAKVQVAQRHRRLAGRGQAATA